MFKHGIVAAMEDETAAAQTELAIDEAGADSMEADLVEAVDLAGDIDAGTDQIEQTVSDAEQLERHAEVLTETEGEGGAAPEVIQATEIAVESICARLGIVAGTGIPALESFSTKAGKARSTRVAIESINAKVKQIWEAVKLAFKKLVNYVKDFFAKLFDANSKMLGRVNALRVKAKAIKGTAGEKISGSGITNVIGGATAAEVKKGIDSANYGDAVKAALDDAENLSGFIAGVADKAAFDKAGWAAAGGSPTNVAAPDGMGWFVLTSFGATDIVYLAPKAAQSGEAAYTAAAKYSVKTNKHSVKGEGEVAPLTQAEINEVLGKVEAKVRELMAAKQTIAQIQGKLDSAIADINKAVSGAGNEGEGEGAGNRSTKARSAVTAVANGSIKAVTLVGSEFTRGLQACLTLVERSIAAYSEKAPEGKAAAAAA